MAASIRELYGPSGERVGCACFGKRFEMLEIGSVQLIRLENDDAWTGTDFSMGRVRSLTPEEVEETMTRIADCKLGTEELIVDLKD